MRYAPRLFRHTFELQKKLSASSIAGEREEGLLVEGACAERGAAAEEGRDLARSREYL
jgi:hypothetical protein